MSKEELIEEILDIIHSENSGLSTHQRLSEIEKMLNKKKTMTDREVLYTVIETASKESKFCENYLGRINSGSEWHASTIVRQVCFTHMFAKAFWGWEEIKIPPPPKGERRAYVVACDWKYHLRQMVMEENPIDYLRKFVEDE